MNIYLKSHLYILLIALLPLRHSLTYHMTFGYTIATKSISISSTSFLYNCMNGFRSIKIVHLVSSSPSPSNCSLLIYSDFLLFFSLQRLKWGWVYFQEVCRTTTYKQETKKEVQGRVFTQASYYYTTSHQDNQGTVNSSAVIPFHPHYLYRNLKFQRCGWDPFSQW